MTEEEKRAAYLAVAAELEQSSSKSHQASARYLRWLAHMIDEKRKRAVTEKYNAFIRRHALMAVCWHVKRECLHLIEAAAARYEATK